MDAPASIRLSFQLSELDVRRFLTAVILKPLAIFLGIIGLILVDIALLASWNRGGLTSGTIAALVIYFAAIPVLLFWGIRRAARKKLRESRTMQGPLEYSFSAQGIEWRSAYSYSETQWGAFVEARETNEYFWLFSQKASAHLLPKRAFANEADMAELRALIREHVKGKITLRASAK